MNWKCTLTAGNESTDRTSQQIALGVIGAGQMATALASAWINAGLLSPEDILASDIDPSACERFVQKTKARTLVSNQEVAQSQKVILLAVKPQAFANSAKSLHQTLNSSHLVISILAGTSLASLRSQLGNECRIVRVMPNTPCLVNASASVASFADNCSEADRTLVGQLFSAVGQYSAMAESYLDAVTGLSGSGPGFVFAFIEALIDGGVLAGLPRPVARQLAAQTVFGSAKLMLETGEHPTILKEMVTSPAGTTINGLAELEAAGFHSAVMQAVVAATERASELSQ